jgi:polyketide biosynthesis enoyl-CoA hydratase PksI
MSMHALSDPARRVVLDDRGDGVLVVAMNDKDGSNAFSQPFVGDLEEILDYLSNDRTAKVVVLAGLSDVFASGAPRELLQRLARGEVAPTDIMLSKAVLDIPVPTIAAMAGHATGGGLALGLCADIILMSRESRYGASFMNLGFTPGMGMTRLLEHVLSPAIAHELLYTGEFRRGSEFAGAAGVNYILPRDEVYPKAMQVAARISEKPRCALELLKRTLSVRRRQAFEESRTLEALMHTISFTQAETRDRIESDYVE